MSFMLTTRQFRERTKTVTRRLGWRFLKVGDVVNGVEKGQGIPKGGTVTTLGAIKIMRVHYERLDRMAEEKHYGNQEAVKEGFPEMTGDDFVSMFCEHNACEPSQEITRIEFDYL